MFHRYSKAFSDYFTMKKNTAVSNINLKFKKNMELEISQRLMENVR